MLKSVFAAITLTAGMVAQSLFAQDVQTIQIDVQGFCGYWRLQNTVTKEVYQCPASDPQHTTYYRDGYSHGSCTLQIPNGMVHFDLKSRTGSEDIEISNSPILSLPEYVAANTILKVRDDGKIGHITMPIFPIQIEDNGFVGRIAIDNYARNLGSWENCHGRTVKMPRSSSFDVYFGGHHAARLEVDKSGFVTSPNKDIVINVDDTTIGLKTIAVLVAPELQAEWVIGGVTDWYLNLPGNFFTGPQMVRLVQGGKYALGGRRGPWADVQGTLFDIGTTCNSDPQTHYVKNVGYFQIREQCGSELPSSP